MLGQGWADVVSYGLMGAGASFVLFGAIGAVIAAIFGLGKARAPKQDSQKETRRKIETFHRILGGGAARMAAADGHISSSEIGMISGILEKYGELRFTEKEIRTLAQGGVKEAQGYLDSVREAKGDLSLEQRRQVIRAALLVAMADLETTQDELAFLRALADALGLSETELNEIRDGVSTVTQRLVGAASAVA